MTPPPRSVRPWCALASAWLVACASAPPPRPAVAFDPPPVVRTVPPPHERVVDESTPATELDPHSLPGLVAALHTDLAVAPERVLAALDDVLARTSAMTETERARITPALLDVLARVGRGTGSVDIRVRTVRALGAVRALDAVDPLSALLAQPIEQQDPGTARAAADALGLIGDPRAVDALVEGLFVRWPSEGVWPESLRALARLGARYAVPALLATLAGRNAAVEQRVARYATLPGYSTPDREVPLTALEALGAFAPPDATPAVRARLEDRGEFPAVRAAAAETFARIALANPAARALALASIARAFDEPPSHDDRPWIAATLGPALIVLRDHAAVPLLSRGLRSPATRGATGVLSTLALLGPFAELSQRADVRAYDAQARALRARVAAPMNPPLDARQLERVREGLRLADELVAVARACADGDLACYREQMAHGAPIVIARAALLLAQTAPPARRADARALLLERLARSSRLDGQDLLGDLERLAPDGCPECLPTLDALAEPSRDTELHPAFQARAMALAARLRARAAHPPP